MPGESSRDFIQDDEFASKHRQIGERIRGLRKQRGLTLQDVQTLSEGRIGFAVLAKLEKGERPWRLDHLFAVAHAFRVDLHDLLPPREGAEALSIEEREVVDAIRAGDLARALKALTKAMEQREDE